MARSKSKSSPVVAGVWVGRFGGAGHVAYLGRDAAQPLLLAVLAASQPVVE